MRSRVWDDTMRVLILSFFYHPEPNDIKIHTLAKTLVERGHEVTAITTFPNYPDGVIYPGYKQKLWQREDKDGVRLIRVPLYPNHSRSSIKRALSYLSFMVSLAVLAPFLMGKRPHVMWVYHPPLTTGLAGWWVSLLRRVPFVYEIQDMWPETLVSTGMFSNQRALRWVAAGAMFIYRRAAAITVNSPGFQQNLIDKGVPAEKVHVALTWADETIYRPVARDAAVGAAHHLEGRFNVIFGGNMGLAQGLESVIKAAALLHDQPEIQFVFIGDGVALPELQAQVRERALTNIRFIERQPAENMPQFFAWGDALLVTLKDDPLFAITIPAKITSYLACGRPIVCAVRGDGANLVQAAGAGIICPPEDASALAKAIMSLYTMARSEREALGAAGRQYFLAHFTHNTLIDRYEALFEQIRR
ncbi:MAG: glycosyltransferase family 4 protein [Anaerolineae bacterium]